ncbi:MAG TPA: aldehyde ferredoxin oxidoreductase family protein [Bacteroidales bacterium]|nr:aldehyde ferredoxin oxidoreductase family protein [Bacteroidales bacterium]
MKTITGASNRVLEVNLSTGKTNVLPISEELHKTYIGSKGLGLKLLYDRLKPGIDPLSEDNLIAFMPGVYMGSGAPCSGRWSALTKSPLTGIMFSTSCGGPFGMSLRTSGWDGLLVTGKAEGPAWLYIDSQGAELRDASHLKGKTTFETHEELAKEGGALVIGPAGENLVRFANALSGHRFLGRGGIGAVLGSKNLKGIVAKGGEFKIEPANKVVFEKLRKLAARQINANKTTSVSYRQFGTRANVMPCNESNILPVNNFSDGSHVQAFDLSGENYRARFNPKYHTCKPCSILCGQKADFDDAPMAVPEYETVGLIGSNLGIFDPVAVAKLGHLCGELGMDTISAGGTIGWAIEATQKGLIDSRLAFGNHEAVEQMITDIANGKGLGKDLALGARAAAVKYGGAEFAIQTKGMELPAYDPRGSYGQALSYSVANRGGCHLSAYLIAQEVLFKLLNPLSAIGKAAYVKFLQNVKEILDSLHTCTFTQFAYLLEPPLVKYTPKPVLALLMQYLHPVAIKLIDFSLYTRTWSAITGIKITNGEMLKAGERIYVLERYMNTREGISAKDDTLPEKLLKDFRKSDTRKRPIPLGRMVRKFYSLRGFDKNGIPTRKTLYNLGIQTG